MNRRHKKKQKIDHLALAKSKLKSKLAKIRSQNIKENIVLFWHQFPALHRKLLLVLTPIVVVLFFLPLPQAVPEQSSSTSRVELDINTTGLSEQKSAQQRSLKSENWREYNVKKGDTLAQVFRNNQLAMADLNSLVKIEGSDKPLSQITQGQLVRFKLAANGQLDILQLEKGTTSVMFFRLSDGSFGRSK